MAVLFLRGFWPQSQAEAVRRADFHFVPLLNTFFFDRVNRRRRVFFGSNLSQVGLCLFSEVVELSKGDTPSC
jgi:hypothetical protein